MHIIGKHFYDRLKNHSRIRHITDTLLNKYLFGVIFLIAALPAAFRTEPLLYDLIPSVLTPFVHIVLCIFFSIVTVKLIGKYASGNGERLYLVLLAVLAVCVLNGDKMQFFDSLSLYFLYFIFGLALMKRTSMGIPLLLFVTILVRPVITVPLIPYAVYLLKYAAQIFPEKETAQKIREIVISCIVIMSIALSSSFFLNRTDFIRMFVPEVNRMVYLLKDVPKFGIVLIVFPFFAFLSYLDSKPLKYACTVSVLCTLVLFLCNHKTDSVLFSYLLMQSIILLGVLRKSVYRYLTDSSKSKRVIFMVIASAVILEQLLFTFVFNDYGSSPGQFRITPFYICYQDFGFIQRGFFGTIFRLLFGTYIPQDTFFTAYFISYLVLKILFFLLIVRTMHYAKSNEDRTVAMLLVFAFLISPGFDKLYFETFGYVMAWAGVLLAYKNRHTVWLIPVFCLIAMLTHQVFASIIFPVVFIALVYRAFIDSQGHTVRNVLVLIMTLLIVGVSFLYFTFFNAQKINFTYEQVCDLIDGISGGFFTPHEDLIRYVYLDSEHEHLSQFLEKTVSQLVNLFLVVLISLPSVFLYVYAFVHSAKTAKSKMKKFGYVISLLSVLAIVPVFISEVDYGRWCSQYVSILVLAPLILTVFRTEENKWYGDMSRKRLYTIMALIVFTALIQPNFHQLLFDYEIRLL